MDLIIDRDTEIYNITISSITNHSTQELYDFKDFPEDLKPYFDCNFNISYGLKKQIRISKTFSRMGIYIKFNREYDYHKYDVFLPYIENESEFNIIKSLNLIKIGMLDKILQEHKQNILNISYEDYKSITNLLYNKIDFAYMYDEDDDTRENKVYNNYLYNIKKTKDPLENMRKIIDIQTDDLCEYVLNYFKKIQFIKFTKHNYNTNHECDEFTTLCEYNLIIYTNKKLLTGNKIQLLNSYSIHKRDKDKTYKIWQHDDDYVIIQEIQEKNLIDLL